ncbi:hypothetical protein [Vallitalea okinawensis]|uniref:hypothetical protein n=1 Tax=Vallitalea okinawensis TaxID=2078660 RepID=UPI000CFD3ED7|nr:hypothetical protein [Vallitalea okinawensis]
MGFNRRRKRVKMFLILLVIPLSIGIVVLGGYYGYIKRINQIEESYQEVIEELRVQHYMNSRLVFIPKETIAAGTVLQEDLFYQKKIKADINPELFMTQEDFGKINLIELKSQFPVMKNSITDMIVSDDMREEEFNMFMLSTNLKEEHYIDVRINFSNGEDYIILAKKKVRRINLDNNTIWLWLNEEEINRISSGIVDAYLHEGTKLYTVTYVQASIQKAAQITYPSNIAVIEVMKNNPNIIDLAKVELAEDRRLALEERLDQISEVEASSIANSRNRESSTRQQVVQESEEEHVIEQEEPTEPEEKKEEQTVDESEVDNGYFDY